MRKKRFMPISASSGSIHDMISALEDKLNEVGASTKIQASDTLFRDPNGVFGLAPDETISYSEMEDYWEENHDSDPTLEQYTSFTEWFNDTVEWLEEVDDVEGCDMPIQAEYDPMYEDVGGGFGEPGERYRYSEMKDYWEKEKSSDPSLLEYDGDFDAWWNDTRSNYLKEVYEDDVEGCDMPVQGASGSIRDMINDLQGKIDEVNSSTAVEASQDIDDQIWEIADRYSTSSPLSGDWNTEPAHLLKAIIDETGISEGEAKSKMISLLGWDPHEVYALEPLDASTSVQAADDSTGIGEDYIQNLMDTVVKTMKMGPKSEYEVDDQKGNILLTSVSDDGVIIEYTIPIEDLGGNLEEDVEYISKSIQEG